MPFNGTFLIEGVFDRLAALAPQRDDPKAREEAQALLRQAETLCREEDRD